MKTKRILPKKPTLREIMLMLAYPHGDFDDANMCYLDVKVNIGPRLIVKWTPVDDETGEQAENKSVTYTLQGIDKLEEAK